MALGSRQDAEAERKVAEAWRLLHAAFGIKGRRITAEMDAWKAEHPDDASIKPF